MKGTDLAQQIAAAHVPEAKRNVKKICKNCSSSEEWDGTFCEVWDDEVEPNAEACADFDPIG